MFRSGVSGDDSATIKSMIVAIEGIDGAGKNTLVTALVERLDAKVLAFPRYQESICAQLVQEALYGRMGDLTDSAYGMATLYALDRHGAKNILDKHAHSDDVLLLDRYVASNAAYSMARTQDPAMAEWVARLEFDKLQLPVPTLQVLLNTPAKLAQERVKKRESEQILRVRDRYESDIDLQYRTAAAYVELADQQWKSVWLKANPEESTADVAERIAQTLQ